MVCGIFGKIPDVQQSQLRTRLELTERTQSSIEEEKNRLQEALAKKQERAESYRLSAARDFGSGCLLGEEASVAEKYSTMMTEVRKLEPFEDVEIPLFEVPFDGLIANITLIPSDDIQGKHLTRQLDISRHLKAVGRRALSSVQLGSDEILLPAGERHNARLQFPPQHLQVREGDELVLHSSGSGGEGLTVPACTMEVVFEQRQIHEELSPPELCIACIPDYWVGKKLLVKYYEQNVQQLRQGSGAFSTTAHEYVGTFLGATVEGLEVVIDQLEHGRLPRNTLFPWGRVTQTKLMENEE
jgi:hypothetical protein